MLRFTALALTALTGFSGLVYEVAWQKYAATLLGSHSEATASVLALFLGGLSIGYALFGRLTGRLMANAAARRQPPRLLVVYGFVEAGIGLHALAFPWLFTEVRRLSFALPHEVSGLGFAVDVALVALLVLPPTILMGGTIPLLTQALSRGLRDATRLHAFVYAFNTLGAFAGALCAGFILIPSMGLRGVVFAMGGVNLLAGASFAVLGLLRPAPPEEFKLEPAGGVRLGGLAAVALLAGFAAMAIQTVVMRIGGMAIGSSEFTFSMVVAVFVLCIAIGSFAVSALNRIPESLLLGVQCALAALLVLLYFVFPDTPYWVHVIRSAFRDGGHAFHFYYAALFLAILALLAVPVGLSGATLPLVFSQLRREFGSLGTAAGRLYAWNTLGSLLGALLGGYLLLFWMNLDRVYAIAIAAVMANALLLAQRRFALPRWTTLALVPLLLGLALLPRWAPERLASGLFRVRQPTPDTLAGPDALFAKARPNDRIAYYRDDPASSVAVFETLGPDGQIVDAAIFNNGKPEASIRGDYTTMALAALIPSLFARTAENAFVIGYGSGVTVGELAALDSMQRIVVAEISPSVIEAAPLFEAYNQHALASAKTEFVISDAFRALQRSDERWDVIVSEPSNVWVTGIEMLFSEEFLTAAKERLRPGGVFAQWFYLYEVDDGTAELVLRTYDAVFDHVAVWYTLGPDVILLGFDDDARALDVAALERRANQPDFTAGLRRSGVPSFQALLAHEVLPLGVLRAAHLEGERHTLLHPLLNHRASRAFFAGSQARLPPTLTPEPARIGAANSLLARHVLERGGTFADADYAAVASELCEVRPIPCATTIAAWQRDVPVSSLRDGLLAELRAQPDYASHLADWRLAALVQLLGGAPLPNGRLTLNEVQFLTNQFETFYHHASPFDRGALAEYWSRCQDSWSGAACVDARTATERRLGNLKRVPAAPNAD